MLAPRASWHLHCLRFVVVTVAILCAFHTVGCGGNKEVPVDAGTPVNVAIAKFKKDLGVLPTDIDELVDRGYLPRTWERGFSTLPEEIKKDVEGKKWTAFLDYYPGASSSQDGKAGHWFQGNRDTSKSTWALGHNGYACDQIHNLDFDLEKLFSEVEQTRAELARRRDALGSRLEQLRVEAPKADSDLETEATELKTRMKDKGLKSLDDIRVDPVAQRRLALIGEIRVRQAAIAEKLKRISDIHEMVLIELKRFDNQDAMVRIAESKAELASLATLLRTSKELLDEKSGTALLGESERIAQGEAWFNNVWAGNEGKRAEIDRWTPYRTKGNMWTSKVTRGGGLTVNYINVKVTDVTDERPPVH